jgi:flagellar hook protein FlgE
MADSLLTAVSGMEAAQTMLSVVGNNLANVNTVGYKSQSVAFQDLFYQTLSQGSQDVTGQSGTDPIQVGLGVSVGGVSSNFAVGSLEQTGRNLDLALQGNGFFVMNNGIQNVYTRAGSFDISSNGFLVDPTSGNKVQRFGNVGETGAVTFQTPGDDDIKVPMGAGIPAQATGNVTFQGNLDSADAIGGTFSTSIQVFDTQGTGHSLTALFTKTSASPDTYSISLSVSGGDVNGSATPAVVGAVSFNANGSLQGPATLSGINLSFSPSLPANQAISLKLGTVGQFNGLTQFGNTASAAAVSQDGSAAGALTSISVAQDGTVQGEFSNGNTLAIAQIAVAAFANTGGLQRVGSNAYGITPNSGPPVVGAAGSGDLGAIQSGSLEQSNVDVSQEFTNLIVAQRAFQVNARAITTTDQTTQSLIAIQ